MLFPTSTGGAARLLRETEPRLNDLIRRGRIRPLPPISAGRRQWDLDHVLQAARALGSDEDDLRRRLGEEVAHAP
jgi:hypothetical protein